MSLKARLPFEKVFWATEHLHKGWKYLRKLIVAPHSPLGAKIILKKVRKKRAKMTGQNKPGNTVHFPLIFGGKARVCIFRRGKKCGQPAGFGGKVCEQPAF